MVRKGIKSVYVVIEWPHAQFDDDNWMIAAGKFKKIHEILIFHLPIQKALSSTNFEIPALFGCSLAFKICILFRKKIFSSFGKTYLCTIRGILEKTLLY